MPNREIQPKMVVLGKVSGIFGVQGWVRVFSHTSPRPRILEYSPWYLGRAGRWKKRKLLGGRAHGKGVVAQFEGCTDRDEAAELLGSQIAVTRDQLPTTSPGEFYWTDLQGLIVKTVSGVDLGRIDHVFATGANDVLVVKGDRERLIPYLWKDVIRQVDLEAGLLLVDWDPDF